MLQQLLIEVILYNQKAEDPICPSAIEREFTITTTDPDDLLYSSITMIQLLKQVERNKFRNFILDSTIFTSAQFIDPNDITFGLQDLPKC